MNENLNTLIIDLSRALNQRRLYFSGHPSIRRSCSQIIIDLATLLSELKEEKLFIGIIDGTLIFDGHALVGPTIMGQQLVRLGQDLHCGGLVFEQQCTMDELEELLELATALKSPIGSLQEARDVLSEHGVRHISLASHYTKGSELIPAEDQVVWQGNDSGGHMHSPLIVYQALFDVVAKAHANVNLERSIDIGGAQSVSEHLLYSTRADFTDMLQFVRYPDYDSYTVGHSVRVATLAVFVGDQLGMENEQLLDLGTAGLLHDIGKSKIDSQILFKPGRLTKQEFAVIRSHASLGAEILMEQRDSTPLQVAAAWGHHLRHDGGGYPNSPPWTMRSHLIALLQICDVFEAITAVRPYKKQLSPLDAYGIMLADTGAFNPGLLHTFITTLGIYPPGNRVRLNDQSQGIVLSSSEGVDKPFLRLTNLPNGDPIADEDHVVNLATSKDLYVEELLFNPTPPDAQ